ncbi:MAG TPA: beta-galactosidase [Lacunisphaera sp.]|jgi:hypothetical protein
MPSKIFLFTLGLIFPLMGTASSPLALSVSAVPPAETGGFHLGTAQNPAGDTLTVDSRSLRLNGHPWTPVMGEFHYTRYPENEWRAELLKMKAGGIDIVATYVFWIHHEEIEGQWNWSGNHSLRRFVSLASEAGLKVIVRCGPWCHGEVRNGGVPDWAIAKGWKIRTDDPPYLEHVKIIYGQIAGQLAGLLWKDGGPVIGIQLENEYDGPAEHLLRLKQIARDAGLDVPIYTRTGWPALSTPMPFGEILPLFGAYAEGFWDRETTSMPGNYWSVFHFSTLRSDANIANEALGRRDVKDAPDIARYPYLTCEIGGGMVSSYHRRIRIDARDIEATTLVKIGSGSVSPGYYMYHGGTNPEGKLSTLMENQGTPATNWNDMPVKNYDFQAPLGQYGQIRPQYQMLRRLHLFLHDFGSALTGMDTFLPEVRPTGKNDHVTLRWAVRSNGSAGFVFVNNYERSEPLPAKKDVQFGIKLADGSAVTFPEKPVTVAADARFIWPFNLDLGHGLKLVWATAQPLCVTADASGSTYYFAQTGTVPAQFAILSTKGARTLVVDRPDANRAPIETPAGDDGRNVKIIVLNEADSLALSQDADTGAIHFDAPFHQIAPRPVEFLPVRAAGPAREIPLGKISEPVAMEPTDADFEHAAVWKIKLPAGFDPAAADTLLRIHYVGDVARVYIGGRLINDDFYNGAPLEIGLRRYAAELKNAELTIAILPLRRDAITGSKPLIFIPTVAQPNFAGRDSVVRLNGVEIVPN